MKNKIYRIALPLILIALIVAPTRQSVAAAFYGAPSQNCLSTGPQDGQAYVYTGINFSGACYLLQMDSSGDSWTSWDAGTGFPNDQVQSVWVGKDVWLVLFWHSFNTKDNGIPMHFWQGEAAADLKTWNKNTSAVRLQRFPFGNCSGSGVVILFSDPNLNTSSINDCTQLTPRTYSNPIEMGFRNDSVSSIAKPTSVPFRFYTDAQFKGSSYAICNKVWDLDLANTSSGVNFTDRISSIAPIISGLCIDGG